MDEKKVSDNLECFVDYLGKASFFQALSLQFVFVDGKRLADLPATFCKQLSPLSRSVVLFNSAVITCHVDACLKAFDVATGLKTSISLLEEGCPIGYASKQPADMYEVEGVFWEGPVGFAIVDLAGIIEPVNSEFMPGWERKEAGLPTYNCKFGGTQPGWIGEMSVPITSALGYASAKSLERGGGCL